MPQLSKEGRQQGGWVADDGTAPTSAAYGPCGFYDGGDNCDALSERRYLQGDYCHRHTPAARAGRPEPAPDPALSFRALAKRQLPMRDQSRYGTATTDPLGRDGTGWHKGPSGLPVRDKGTKGT